MTSSYILHASRFHTKIAYAEGDTVVVIETYCPLDGPPEVDRMSFTINDIKALEAALRNQQ